jgi:DNA polymerase-3 subunit delta
MSKPTVYILHGDDTFAIQRHLDAMLAKMGDPGIAELNLTQLDGREAGEETIFSAANAMPFLAERRMVVLTHPFARLKAEPARVRFREMLDKLPESTAFVMVIDDVVERGEWTSMNGKHWLRRWMNEAGPEKHHYQLCQLPQAREMPEWIRREAKEQGGQFSPAAAAALVQHIGSDTRAASLEIDKLLSFVNRGRAVESEDVEELSAQSGQANIFVMIDAIATGNTSVALNLLHRLLEEEDEISLFGMIVRQFRLLIQTREVLDEGKGVNGVVEEIDRRDFIARKLVEQATRFSMTRLNGIYHRLLAIDEAVKTGQSGMGVALDVLIAELSR